MICREGYGLIDLRTFAFFSAEDEGIIVVGDLIARRVEVVIKKSPVLISGKERSLF